MKIRKLQLKNIGVFDDEIIRFKSCSVQEKAEVHILTGVNGSGKSTILMALASAFYGWKEDWEDIDEESVEKDSPKNLPVNTERGLYKRFRYFEDDGSGFRSQISVSTDTSLNIYGINEFDEDAEDFLSEDVIVSGFPKSYYGVDEIRSTTFNDEIASYREAVSSENTPEVDFVVFTYSGYRFIKSEKVELLKESNENPLKGSLDFIKTYENFTINQWLANNLSQRALAKEEKNKQNAEKFDENVKNLAKLVSDIIGYKIDFKLKYSPPQLVLKTQETELDFDVLPDGLRSLISWMGDLLMRVDLLKWDNNLTTFEKNIILLLDEIEVHLHPAWQRKVLPIIQKLFKNAQIFVSTHSPFVVNSVDDAWVYKLELENGNAHIADVVKSKDGISYQTVLSEIFGIDKEFGGKTQDDLDRFYSLVRNGKNVDEKELKKLAKSLAEQSEELNSIVQIELRQFNRRRGKEISI